ncbi:MAG: hypothetical protein BWK80_40180 [Desulfobacteraceae bacterium IS3]|nr:MAG: hypothetical protein BWK80_40180 [Desulfobacteraceae bacterium IS3]
MNTISEDTISKKEIYRFRVRKIVDRLLQESPVFQEELNRDDVIESLTDEMQKFSFEEFLMIDDNDLKGRIGRMIAVDMLSKLIDDFTPEQKRIFNEAVEGR